MTGPEASPPVEILGVPVQNLSREAAVERIRNTIVSGGHLKIAFLNAHCGNIAATNAEYLETLLDFLVLPDGIGADLAGRILQGEPFRANLNGTDFVPHVLREIRAPITVGLLGARPGHAEKAAARLARSFPHHRFEVIGDGYFRPEQEHALLERIAQVQPALLLVAMGVPRQELWIRQNLDEQHARVALGVGALIDFLSGAVPRAPGWIRKLRLEWLYRLFLEPRRMWKRYVLGNPLFLWRVIGQRRRMRSRAR